jgi:hypothetical protein
LTRVNVIQLFSFIADHVAHVLKGIVQRERSVLTEGCFLKDPIPRTSSSIPNILRGKIPRFEDTVLNIAIF